MAMATTVGGTEVLQFDNQLVGDWNMNFIVPFSNFIITTDDRVKPPTSLMMNRFTELVIEIVSMRTEQSGLLTIVTIGIYRTS